MRSPTLDLMAGERARRIRIHPDGPEPVSDPMDSRYGEMTPSAPQVAAPPRPIVDPTDPDCGESSV
jgi:hypothetical protein